MKIIGLTGSIAMGKSTAAKMLQHMGVPVFDADAAVHVMYAKGGRAVPLIASAFPTAIVDGAVDRQRLGAEVLGHKDNLDRLEKLVHPLVNSERTRFLRHQQRVGRKFVALDNPLLFEMKSDRDTDAVFVVSAHRTIQKQRALARPGMTVDKLRVILSKQMPDHKKRMLADFVIPSGGGKALTYRSLKRALRHLRFTA